METSDTEGQYVPCGRCYNCVQTKRSVWTFRILMELRDAESAYFITLTYDEKNVPMVQQWDGSIVQTLKSEELTKFFKSLRMKILKDTSKYPVQMERYRWQKKSEITGKFSPRLRYFAVGEYGGRTKRPHYHIILYNLPTIYVRKDPFGKFYSDQLEKIWKKGMIDIGKVEQGSAHYMTKYHLHPFTGSWQESDKREKPFVRMSRKPGIGANYITDETRAYYRDSKNMCATLKNGIRQPLGRYYKEKILHEQSNYRDIQVKAAIERRKEEEKFRDTFPTEEDYLKYERDRYRYLHKKGERQLRKNNKI